MVTFNGRFLMTNLIEEMKEVFELANNVTSFIKNVKETIKKEKSDDKQDDNGDSSRLAASGAYSKLAASGAYSKLAASGYSSQLAASGYYSQLAASGAYSKLAASGYSSQLESTGEKSVISAIGVYNVAKAKIGSWITLAEYKYVDDHYEVDFVKTEYVDGKTIKEDVFYTLCNHEFKEYGEFDRIKCAILSHKKDIYKVKNFFEENYSYVIEKDGIYSHGKTIKEARESFIYKISNRDASAYKNLNLDSIVTFEEAIKMYRVITGACEYGTKNFVSQLPKIKKVYSIREVIEITKGQYGNDTLTHFFEEK